MKKIYPFRAKQILSSYLNKISYAEHNSLNTEQLLQEDCPRVLKGKTVIESARICALAFDLINYLEWNSGSLLAYELKLKLNTLCLFYRLAHNDPILLNKDLLTNINAFLFTQHNKSNPTNKQEDKLALDLCLCALITAHREEINSQHQPTKGPNARHYLLHQVKTNKNLFFTTSNHTIAPNNYLQTTKEKIKDLYEDLHQLDEQIQQSVTPYELKKTQSQINDLQSKIQQLKFYIINHQILLNPRVKSSLTKLELAAVDLCQKIKNNLATPIRSKLPSAKIKRMYATPSR